MSWSETREKIVSELHHSAPPSPPAATSSQPQPLQPQPTLEAVREGREEERNSRLLGCRLSLYLSKKKDRESLAKIISFHCWISIREWLESQNEGSVLYVALGSEVSLSQKDVTELALGLELPEVPFFWVLRKLSESFQVPDGFEERVKGRGNVWKGWAPQLNIPNHESVGGFLTHCGWSSCIEELMFGHPLIMPSFLVDQGLNARVMEDRNVGIEIPRNDPDRSYTRDLVAQCVRLIMVENEGKMFGEKAKEMSGIFRDRELNDGYVGNFIDYLENNRHNC
ncbi:UDP-glycosyltransferase 91D1-like [Coffea eugenioides]|uniref:UDP-glycosyltransferase 91D1-like n=1 Tax=Coffea eugenioides TaxID=49369 RepID=UPI000F6119F1|nr:UDP-glycosyltransferase 91D1-like [Coffea eugenioides]